MNKYQLTMQSDSILISQIFATAINILHKFSKKIFFSFVKADWLVNSVIYQRCLCLAYLIIKLIAQIKNS
jgi:hypothetical protein